MIPAVLEEEDERLKMDSGRLIHNNGCLCGEEYEGSLVLVRCGSAVVGEEQEVWRGGGMAWPMVEWRFIAKRAKQSC